MPENVSPARTPSAIRPRHVAVVALCLVGLAGGVSAQTPAMSQRQKPAAAPHHPDANIVDAEPQKPRTAAELKSEAWGLLSDNVQADTRAEARIQALAALGLMGGNPQSLGMIRKAMDDKDIDIRVAAVLAAGQTRSPNIAGDLRRMLDDKEPGVAFTAALTLWKMHDASGEDILTAVADGERKTDSSLMTGTEHRISKQLHDPAGMAKFGAMQGAYMLLGPFGYGLTAFEYLHKNGGDAARVSAIEAMAQMHTGPIRAELISGTTDKDLGVRAASCKALARYHDRDVPPALVKMFDDPKLPVRLTAAAAYLVSTGAAPGSPVEGGNLQRAAKPASAARVRTTSRAAGTRVP